MKTIKRILSVILTLALMMSLICVPGYAEDTKTIDLAIEFSALGDQATPLTSVEAGTEFTMWVTFDKNPTVKAESIQAYDLLIGYNSAKIAVSGAADGKTNPTFNKAFVDGVMYAGWSGTNGIAEGKTIVESGVLFQVNAKATTALTAADLRAIEFIAEATNADGKKQLTQLLDGNQNKFNYNQIFTVEAEDKTIDLAIEFSALNDESTPVTSVAAGTDFTMWVTFDGNPTVKADSIQAYDLLIGYNSAKIAVSGAADGKTNPTFNKAFVDGVMYAGWSGTNGIAEGKTIVESGVLFQVNAKATTALTAADLRAIEFIAEATNADGKKQLTQLLDGNQNKFNYNQIFTVDADADAKTIELAIEFSALNDKSTPVASVAAGTDFTMWVTFDKNPAVKAESIQAYDLLIGYDSTKIAVSGAADGKTNPTFNKAFIDGVMYAGWSGTNGIAEGKTIVESGVLFQINAKAAKKLTAEDLLEIEFIAEATNAYGRKQYTQLLDGNQNKLKYVGGAKIEEVEAKTIDLAIQFTAYNNITKPLESVSAGTDFTMWVAFDKNPTVKAESIQAYDLLIGYDSAKMVVSGAEDGLTSPTFNKDFVDGVMYAGWSESAGIAEGKNIVESGVLFQINAKATERLTAEDLSNIKFIAEATNAYDRKQYTQLLDGNQNKFNYNQVSKIIEIEAKTIDLSIVFSEYDDMESPIASVSEGELFSMWVTFDGNPTVLADSIQAYDLLISYNPDKILLSDEDDELGAYGLYDVFNPEFADGVMYAGWSSVNGIVEGKDIVESGVLFQIDAKAAADIKASDLLAMEFIAEATNADGKKQFTQLLDGSQIRFDYVQIPTVEPGDEPEEPEEPEEPVTKEINASDFTFVLDDVEYTGSAIEPAVTSDTLEEGTDYKVTYSNNIEVGTATITVTGIGDYTGTVTKTFNIVAKEEPGEPEPPAGPTIEIGFLFTEYDEREKPVTSVAAGEKFTMWVTFAGNPTVLAESIQGYDFVISYDAAAMTFLDEDGDGRPDPYGGLAVPVFSPEFTNNVAYAGWTSMNGLVGKKNIEASGDLFFIEVMANRDLTIDDLSAIVLIPEAVDSAGKRQLTQLINGNKDKFNYVQIPTFPEEEEPVVITEADFALAETSVVYTGSEIKPAVTSELAAGTDYEVAYANNTNVGTATVTITGIGNYTGTVTLEFAITAKAIAEADFTFDLADKEYTGSEIKPAVTSSLAASSYTVSYTNNVEAGTATITVTGKGNYTGTIVKTFTIKEKAPEEPEFARGDVDGDGSVTSTDALRILQIVVGDEEFTPTAAQRKRAEEVDKAAGTTSTDALYVLIIVVGGELPGES